jgi:hypothetical protein
MHQSHIDTGKLFLDALVYHAWSGKAGVELGGAKFSAEDLVSARLLLDWAIRHHACRDERTDLRAQRDELAALLRKARASVEYEMQDLHESYGERLMHKQQPVIDLLRDIDATLARLEK